MSKKMKAARDGERVVGYRVVDGGSVGWEGGKWKVRWKVGRRAGSQVK
jgi:hypothetical protein